MHFLASENEFNSTGNLYSAKTVGDTRRLKVRKHLIFRSLCLKLLIYHFKKPLHPKTSLTDSKTDPKTDCSVAAGRNII